MFMVRATVDTIKRMIVVMIVHVVKEDGYDSHRQRVDAYMVWVVLQAPLC